MPSDMRRPAYFSADALLTSTNMALLSTARAMPAAATRPSAATNTLACQQRDDLSGLTRVVFVKIVSSTGLLMADKTQQVRFKHDGAGSLCLR